jgi:hypothetical protein
MNSGISPAFKTVKTDRGQTVNIAPSWAGILPALIALIENGNGQGRRFAISELERLAQLVDANNKALREAGRVID